MRRDLPWGGRAPLWSKIEALAQAAIPPRSVAGLFDRWVASAIAADKTRFLGRVDLSMVRRAMKATRRAADAAQWMKAYRALPDLLSLSAALSDLEGAWRAGGGPGLTAPTPEAIASAAAAASWDSRLEPSAKAWLDASLASEQERRASQLVAPSTDTPKSGPPVQSARFEPEQARPLP